MGVSWYVDSDGVGRPPKDSERNKPILLLLPGLGGGINNLYTHMVASAAMKEGYKCGVFNSRLSEDIPITSYKVTCSYSSDDANEVIEFVYQNYVFDK